MADLLKTTSWERLDKGTLPTNMERTYRAWCRLLHGELRYTIVHKSEPKPSDLIHGFTTLTEAVRETPNR
jgi:hypothetical protein